MSIIDDERAMLGYLLAHPDRFHTLIYGSEIEAPIGGGDFTNRTHSKLFAMIRQFHQPYGNFQDLVCACEAKPVKKWRTERGLPWPIEENDFGWFEFEGGADWLQDLMDEAPDNIDFVLDRFIEARYLRGLQHAVA